MVLSKKGNMERNKKDLLKLIKLAEREIREWQKVLAELKEQLGGAK